MVSVIITTYKRPARVLKRAIDSVFSQSYKDFELIVVNDAPLYDERETIDSLVSCYKLNYIVNDESRGAGYSRNIGANYSNGDYLAYLDDDDEWLPNKLSEMIPLLNASVGFVYSDMIIKNNYSEATKCIEYFEPDMVLQKLLDRNYIGGFSNPIFSKQLFEECGRMDETLLSSQDADLWRRLAMKTHFAHIAKPLIVYYSLTDGSITGNPHKRIRGTIALLDKYKEQYEKYPSIRTMHVNRSTQNYIRSGWFKEAFRFFCHVYTKKEQLFNIYIIPLGIIKRIIDKIR